MESAFGTKARNRNNAVTCISLRLSASAVNKKVSGAKILRSPKKQTRLRINEGAFENIYQRA
jgi:hypothetical protein